MKRILTTAFLVSLLFCMCEQCACLCATKQPLDFATPGFDLMDALEPFLRSHLEGASDEVRWKLKITDCYFEGRREFALPHTLGLCRFLSNF